MSDDISEPGKISKKIIPSRLKHIETTFDERVSEVDRKGSHDMSDDISDPGKIIRVISGIF
jgi:hypothetical protein